MIFMTGDPGAARALSDATRTKRLEKPFSTDELRKAIAEVVA